MLVYCGSKLDLRTYFVKTFGIYELWFIISVIMFVPYVRMSRLRRQRTDALSESDSLAPESPDVSDTESSEQEEAGGNVPDHGEVDSSGNESSESDSESYTGELELAPGRMLYISITKP